MNYRLIGNYLLLSDQGIWAKSVGFVSKVWTSSEGYGPDFRSDLLILASEEGHKEIVAYLIKRGANPNISEERGFEKVTPLQLAARGGYKDIVALLVSSGADVDSKDTAPAPSPLQIVARKYSDSDIDDAEKPSYLEIAELLIDKGANLRARYEADDSILHSSLIGPEVTAYLITKGADANARNEAGWTPLHSTALIGNIAKAQVLLQHGADLNATTNTGSLPEQCAGLEGIKAFFQDERERRKSTTTLPEPKAKGGCVGAVAVIAVLTVGIIVLLLVTKGTTASRGSSITPIQPAYSATTNVSEAFTSPNGVNTGSTSPNRQGEHFPQTRNAYLHDADIQGWSYSGVRYAMNEMYARHGYLFKDGPLRHQFQKFAWYQPTPAQTSATIEAQFTPIERANQHLLAERRDVLVQEGQAIK